MTKITPIDAFCEGRIGLPELLTEIERAFAGGDSSAQAALLASWRKQVLKTELDHSVYHVIDEKIATEHGKPRPGAESDEKTVIPQARAPCGRAMS